MNFPTYKQTFHVKYEDLCHLNPAWGPHCKLMSHEEKMYHDEYGIWCLLMDEMKDVNEHKQCVERVNYSLNLAEVTKIPLAAIPVK